MVSSYADTEGGKIGKRIDSNKGSQKCKGGGDIHKEIKDSIPHQLLYVFVGLPLLGCSIHSN